MSQVENRWKLYTSHVKVKLREAKDEVEMLDFMDQMIKYLEEQRYSKPRVADFRKEMIQYMAKEIVSRSLHADKALDPRKMAVFDPEEECLIAKRKDMVKIEQWIGHRNNQLVKVVQYRLVR